MIRMLSNKNRVVEVPMDMWTNGRKQVCWKALKPRVMPHRGECVTVQTSTGEVIAAFKARSLQPTEDPHTFTAVSSTGYFGVDAHLMVEDPRGRGFTFSYLNTHDHSEEITLVEYEAIKSIVLRLKKGLAKRTD